MNKEIFVYLDEFEKAMTIDDYDDVISLMRSLYNREFELVRKLPEIENHSEKIVVYKKKVDGLLDPMGDMREVLRNKEPIILDRTEFMWTIGLTQDAYVAFVCLTAIGDVHSLVTNPFSVFKSFRNEASTRAIIVHTHPSEVNVNPSDGDCAFTKKLLYMAGHAGIKLEDHIIIGRTSEYSFLQNDKLEALQRELDVEMSSLHELEAQRLEEFQKWQQAEAQRLEEHEKRQQAENQRLEEYQKRQEADQKRQQAEAQVEAKNEKIAALEQALAAMQKQLSELKK